MTNCSLGDTRTFKLWKGHSTGTVKAFCYWFKFSSCITWEKNGNVQLGGSIRNVPSHFFSSSAVHRMILDRIANQEIGGEGVPSQLVLQTPTGVLVNFSSLWSFAFFCVKRIVASLLSVLGLPWDQMGDPVLISPMGIILLCRQTMKALAENSVP